MKSTNNLLLSQVRRWQSKVSLSHVSTVLHFLAVHIRNIIARHQYCKHCHHHFWFHLQENHFNMVSTSTKRCVFSPLQYPQEEHRLGHPICEPWRCHTWRWQSCPRQTQPRGRGRSWCCRVWWSRWGQWEAILYWSWCPGTPRFVTISPLLLTWRWPTKIFSWVCFKHFNEFVPKYFSGFGSKILFSAFTFNISDSTTLPFLVACGRVESMLRV